MKKFEVVVNTCVHTLYSKVIEVEASSEEEAEKLANEEIETNEELIDLGNWYIEDTGIDVEVVNITPLKEDI